MRSDRERWRLLAAVTFGVVIALWVRSRAITEPTFTSDFDQLWAATRAWMEGRNPYREVGLGAAFEWKWPLYYPMPALLLTAPLAWLPLVGARMVFAGVSSAVFVWAITRDGWQRWPILLSISFVVSVDLVQWSLLLTAVYFLPQLGGVLAAKPNFGLPYLAAARPDRRLRTAAITGATLLLLSFILRPSWPGEWYENLRSAPHFVPPVARPWGWLLLLSALEWRRPEARWFLALSCMPQPPSFYDQVLLVVVCARWWETLLLVAGTWALFFRVKSLGMPPDYALWGPVTGNASVLLCYLPALAIVLRPRLMGLFRARPA